MLSTSKETWRRKALLLLTGGLVCLYAVSVLWYVQTIPDMGLRSAFSPIINHVDRTFLRDEEGAPPPNLRDCVIVQIGEHSVDTWPQILRALSALRQAPVQADDPTRVEGLTHIR